MTILHNTNTMALYGDLSREVKTALDDLSADESVYVPQRPATELFKLEDGVQIFFVSPDGRVSTFSAPSRLRIFRFQEQASGEQWVPVFIQVGGWTHPLIPGASPVLEAANGAFMFPDAYTDDPGSAIGIVLSDEVPQDVRDEFRRILDEHTALQKSEGPPQPQLGAIGKTLVKSAEIACKGMDYTAQKACELIEYVGEREKQKRPAAQEDTKVGPTWRYTAKGARYATHATVKVSGFVANRVGKLTKSMADALAKQAAKPVTGAVTGVTGGSATKSSSMHNLVDAARGGLLAFGTVYAGLEESATVLGGKLKDKSVEVVEHGYGQEAGDVYKDAATAAGNAAMTYMHVSSLGVKGMVKRTAKDTAKGVGKRVLDAHVKDKGGQDVAQQQQSQNAQDGNPK